MAVPEPEGVVRCASYTHARRHPMVLGRIAGWAPPFQLTLTQIAVLLVTFGVLVRTWSLWAPILPGTVAMMVTGGVPMTAAWAVRRVRVEGRSLPRAFAGYLALWCAPAAGRTAGRPQPATSRARPAHGRAWMGTARR